MSNNATSSGSVSHRSICLFVKYRETCSPNLRANRCVAVVARVASQLRVALFSAEQRTAAQIIPIVFPRLTGASVRGGAVPVITFLRTQRDFAIEVTPTTLTRARVWQGAVATISTVLPADWNGAVVALPALTQYMAMSIQR